MKSNQSKLGTASENLYLKGCTGCSSSSCEMIIFRNKHYGINVRVLWQYLTLTFTIFPKPQSLPPHLFMHKPLNETFVHSGLIKLRQHSHNIRQWASWYGHSLYYIFWCSEYISYQVPFTKFVLTNAGYLQDQQMAFPRIRTLGFTLADWNTGPFHLEIDYIKLVMFMYQPKHFKYHWQSKV